jgi:hypothetical protein
MKYFLLISFGILCMILGVSIVSLATYRASQTLNESRIKIANLETVNDDLRRKMSEASFDLASFERLTDSQEKTQSDLQTCLIALGELDRQQRELPPCAMTIEECGQYQSALQSPE